MVRLSEITSTERLLNIIRNKAEVPLNDKRDGEKGRPPALPPPQKKSKLVSFGKMSAFKPLTVGVDIGHEYLMLVKNVKSAGGQPAFAGQKRILIPSGLERASDEFANFLREQLGSFCGANKNLHVWAIISSASVDVHHIRVPRVPKKQLQGVVYWTVKKETQFDENANILDFEVLGETIEQGIAKWSIMYYTAPKQEIEDAKKLFSRAGWPLTGLSISPFAVQNILRNQWLADNEGTVASLFIGNDFSHIDIFTKGNLVMTRGIKAGISSMMESLMEAYSEKTAISDGVNAKPQMDRSQARGIIFSLSPDSRPLMENERFGLQEGEIWEMVLPALERLIRQVERTFEHFSVNLGNERVGKIYVSGAMNVYQPIVEYIGAQLAMPSELFDPLSPQLSGRYKGGEVPVSVSERIAFAPALGMALSDNKLTPNFIFTYRDKELEASVKHINRLIFMVFIALVFICLSVFLYQKHAIAQRETARLDLENQLSRFNPPVDKDIIMKTLSTIKQDIVSLKIYGKRYRGVAVISELANLIFPEIRLISIKVKLGSATVKQQDAVPEKADAAEAKNAAHGKPAEETKEVEIEGFVVGDENAFDEKLGNYVIKLDNSPLFKEVKVQKGNMEKYRKTTLLRFSINMKLEGM